MPDRLLVANRGEIAIRIMRTAAIMGIHTTAVYSSDDSDSLHVFRADEAIALESEGAAAYLDVDGIIKAAKRARCDAIHPGYGFLSENAAFAHACKANGITWIGPSPETLAIFGDKGAARQLAESQGIPVLKGTSTPTNLDEAQGFFEALADADRMIIKAIGGGGGRGVRIITDADEIADAFARCAHEAEATFGNSALYVEQFMPQARHVEVQVLADNTGKTMHLGERDCSLQRRHQKIVEIAPAPGLDDALRKRIHDAAVKLARAASYTGAGTIEFLVDTANQRFAFIEANARLQVEHTITEAITGVDLVEAQIRIARGEQLDAIIDAPVRFSGTAIQLRINMETMLKNGFAKPGIGTLTAFNPPFGPDVRLDTYAYPGYSSNPHFDSLLAKLIVHQRHGDFSEAAANAWRALCEFQIEGIATNISFLQNLMVNEDVKAMRVHTRFIDENIKSLVAEVPHPKRYLTSSTS